MDWFKVVFGQKYLLTWEAAINHRLENIYLRLKNHFNGLQYSDGKKRFKYLWISWLILIQVMGNKDIFLFLFIEHILLALQNLNENLPMSFCLIKYINQEFHGYSWNLGESIKHDNKGHLPKASWIWYEFFKGRVICYKRALLFIHFPFKVFDTLKFTSCKIIWSQNKKFYHCNSNSCQ